MTPDPTPQHHDHGAAGFCGNHGQAVSDALTEVAYRAWCTARRGKSEAPGEYEALYSRIEAEWMAQVVAAVVAALDDETARLRGEVEHWQQTCTWWNEACQRAWEQRDFNVTAASAIEADLTAARAALARVRALATDSRDRGGFGGVRLAAHVRIADLLAALDPEEPR